jgi:hypothetical protein
MRPITLMSLTRTEVGVGCAVAPNAFMKLFGVDLENNPQTMYFARMFGIRDVVLAVGALTSTGTARRMWLQTGIVCDAVDAVAAIIAARDGGFSRPSAVVGTALPLLGIGFGVASIMNNSAEASTQAT